jgi:DNA-3-methyladenine glycosylase
MIAMRPARSLRRRFYERPCDVVARALLGKLLVHGDRAGMIVETEAYLGEDDLASHARFGKTRRNAVMYGPGGVSYVYLCYGVYDLFNVVTGGDGQPQAVLIRALELARGRTRDMAAARGPGKLTRALGLNREHSGIDLTGGSPLTIAAGRAVRPAKIRCGPRVGVDYAGAWAQAPLRFWIDDHPAVSGPRSHGAAK